MKRYVQCFMMMFVSQISFFLIFQQKNLSDRVVDMFGAAVLGTFFFWIYEWSKPKKSVIGEKIDS